MKIGLHTKHGVIERDISPVLTNGEIHIYGGGTSGYKLSIGKRHLTLAELAMVVDIYNKKLNNTDPHQIRGGEGDEK